MPVSSLFRLFSSSARFSSSPLLLPATHAKISSVAEKYCAHLLKHSQDPEKTLGTIRARLDASCINEVLDRFSSLNQPLLGLRFFIWSGLQSKGYRHSKYMYRRACKLFAISQNPSCLFDVVEAYRVERFVVDVKLFKVILSLCEEAKAVDEALWVLRKMEEFECRPDTTAYNVTIRLVCGKADMDMAIGLVKEMESMNLHPDMITFMALIEGFCHAGRVEDAYELLKQMKEHGCTPNSVAYSAILHGACKLGRMVWALELLSKMEREGGEYTPNVITYTSVIQSFCENGQSIEALQILDRMENCHCAPNRVTVSTLINGLCTEGKIDEVHELINKVVGKGSVSISECYSSFVVSLLRVKRPEDAFKLFSWMLSSALKPDGLSSSDLIKYLCSEGRYLDGFNLCEEIEKMCCLSSIDSDVYFALLVGLCRQGHLVETETLVGFMIQRGIKINASSLQQITQCLKGLGRMELLSNLCGVE